MNLEKRQRLTREPAALKDHKENTQDANIASKLHTPAPKGDLVRVNNWLVSPLNPSKCLRVVISNEVHLHSPEIEYHREILEHIRARANSETRIKYKVINEDRPISMLKHRAEAVRFAFGVGAHLKLQRKTVHYMVHLYDMYLQKYKPHSEKEYPLISMTCIHISNKIHQIYYPDLKEVKNVVQPEQVYQKEADILNEINYNLTSSTALDFLQYWLMNLQMAPDFVQMCFFVLDLLLFDYHVWFFGPEEIALGVIHYMCKRQGMGFLVMKETSVGLNEVVATSEVISRILLREETRNAMDVCRGYTPSIVKNGLFLRRK